MYTYIVYEVRYMLDTMYLTPFSISSSAPMYSQLHVIFKKRKSTKYSSASSVCMGIGPSFGALSPSRGYIPEENKGPHPAANNCQSLIC